MAQPSPRGKGRRALRLVGLALLAAVVSFPMSFIATIMMNPILGRLEAAWGIELTGHSGPADWIFELVFGITTIVVFTALVLLTRRGRPPQSDEGRGEPNTGDRDVAL